MAQITYEDKQTLNTNPSIPSVNKIESGDMNQIKSVVNENDTNVGSLSNLNTTDKTSVINAINEVNTNQINSNTYSTNETVIGIWVNNKPIYRKVIDFGALPNNTSKIINHNIENIEEFVSVKGIAHVTTTDSFYSMPFAGTPVTFSGAIVAVRATLTELTVSTTNDRSTDTAYVILEYTKTTDEPIQTFLELAKLKGE